jgi:hypothetical protein
VRAGSVVGSWFIKAEQDANPLAHAVLGLGVLDGRAEQAGHFRERLLDTFLLDRADLVENRF